MTNADLQRGFQRHPNGSDVTIILAAHGSKIDSEVNRAIEAIGARIRLRHPWRNVCVAFHHGIFGFTQAFEQATTPVVIIVPFLTSHGYFAQRISKEFETTANKNPGIILEVAQPVGTHFAVEALVSGRIESLFEELKWNRNDTTIVLVGHGTRKSINSRNSTNTLVESLKTRFASSSDKIKAAFIDDDPRIEDVVISIDNEYIIVIPFLISHGPHARIDIPRRFGLGKTNGILPAFGDACNKQVYIDQPFGSLPEIDNLIVTRIEEALQRLPRQFSREANLWSQS